MSADCDFDLSQDLDGPPEVDKRKPESSSATMTGAEEETFHPDQGLDLVVSCSGKGLQRVANLLLAANRMKMPSELCSDTQLCNTIMDDVVQEIVVDCSGHATATADASAKPVYSRVWSGDFCHLLDLAQKAVVKASAGLALKAITLKGGHGERRVNFKMAKYMPSCGANDDGQTVALSIGNSSLHISCSMKGGRAALSLEECSKESLQTIGADGMRFLFRKRTCGNSLAKFESVKCRGWFISTSCDNENEPVEMYEADAVRRCYNFHMP